jgi:hypothetical protein
MLHIATQLGLGNTEQEAIDFWKSWLPWAIVMKYEPNRRKVVVDLISIEEYFERCRRQDDWPNEFKSPLSIQTSQRM